MTKEYKHQYTSQDTEIADYMIIRLIDIFRDNPFPPCTDTATETIWHHFSPYDYARMHAREFGECSTRLIEAKAAAALLIGNLADAMFYEAALAESPPYALGAADKMPWQTKK